MIKYNVFDIDIAFYYEDLKVFIPIVVGLIGFMIFWFTQKSPKVKEKLIAKYGKEKGQAKLILYSRHLGGFTIGVLPLIAFMIAFPGYKLSQLGVALYSETWLATFLWIAGLSVIIIPLTSFSARKPENLINYPQIRTSKWNRSLLIKNLFSWFVYLLGYEFFFRGILLFPLAGAIGVWPAIAVNIGLYAATHIPKGLTETIGAIPLSIVLCILSLQTGTIWIAFFVHVVMSWTNATVALKHNPMMIYQTKI